MVMCRRTRVSISLLRLLTIAMIAGVGVTARDAAAQGPSERPSERPAQEARRSARVSEDLQEQLATGNVRDVTVILTGSAAQVTRIAERHGLVIARWLETAGVIDVPAARLRALADDSEVDQLSTNQVLRSQ